jgi:hypothetical protein
VPVGFEELRWGTLPTVAADDPLGHGRRLQVLARLLAGGSSGLEVKQLCDVAVEVTQMTGAGIMLMSGDIPQGSLCTTNTVSALIEELIKPHRPLIKVTSQR